MQHDASGEGVRWAEGEGDYSLQQVPASRCLSAPFGGVHRESAAKPKINAGKRKRSSVRNAEQKADIIG